MEVPKINSVWQHNKTGNKYVVTEITNLQSTRLDEYPVTVVYQRLVDDTIWSRPLSKWHESYAVLLDHRVIDQEFIFAALGEIINRIELCGASVELTHAVSLASDLRQAVGNKHNQANSFAFERVKLSLDGKA